MSGDISSDWFILIEETCDSLGFVRFNEAALAIRFQMTWTSRQEYLTNFPLMRLILLPPIRLLGHPLSSGICGATSYGKQDPDDDCIQFCPKPWSRTRRLVDRRERERELNANGKLLDAHILGLYHLLQPLGTKWVGKFSTEGSSEMLQNFPTCLAILASLVEVPKWRNF